jgi:hypothetical protein
MYWALNVNIKGKNYEVTGVKKTDIESCLQ